MNSQEYAQKKATWDAGFRAGYDQADAQCGQGEAMTLDPNERDLLFVSWNKLEKPMPHQQRHVLLHQHLDELFADYIQHHPNQHSYLTMPLEYLLKWSHEQTLLPTETT